MRDQIHTIPVNEAFEAGDECPFCYMERKVEQSAIRYVAGAGASYMEPDIREGTDRKGFCVHHMKKLYDYGNFLGNALMLQTHMASLITEFRNNVESAKDIPKKGLLPMKKQKAKDPYWKRLESRVQACYICDKMEYNMARYISTFFALLKELEFREKVANSKGFCLRHFARILEAAEEMLPNSQREWFCETVFSLMEENLVRVKEDLDWFVAKHDYRNAGADWKNSKDAVSRTMQKLEGLYPADPVYRNDR